MTRLVLMSLVACGGSAADPTPRPEQPPKVEPKPVVKTTIQRPAFPLLSRDAGTAAVVHGNQVGFIETNSRVVEDSADPDNLPKRITDRLVNEGFTTFDGSVDTLRIGDNTVGAFRVKRVEQTEGLKLTVGQHSELFEVSPQNSVGNYRCEPRAVVQRVWFSNAHERLLLRVAWPPPKQGCDLLEDEYWLVEAG